MAARLALAGKKTLLIDAGDDQGSNVNYTVPAYQAKSTEDEELAWSFYVRHYQDDARQKRDFKLTYTLPDGSEYTGLNPPAGATIKGVLYPRTATLGGCTAHNALVAIYADRSDFQYIADLTGDSSWNPSNIRNYWIKLERNSYLPSAGPLGGHGLFGWLSTQVAPLTLAVQDLQLFGMISGAAQALGGGAQTLQNYLNVLTNDANADSDQRDQTQALYQIPISSNQGARNGAREFVLQVANAKDALGNKLYPLDLRLNCHVTKVTFDTTQTPPRATGVEFLDGKYLYRASPKWRQAAPGTPGSALANKEVIVAGGSYNSPQILKLSGIGPRAELEKFGIPVIKDLPGVGTNLQDHYEVATQATMAKDFSSLDGCNFAFDMNRHPIPAEQDPCYLKWRDAGPNGPTANRGVYASSGFAAGMFVKTGFEPDNNYGLLSFGGPVNFRGYFPGYSYNATMAHNWFTWATLKSHPRNRAGTVTLRSADPLDVPDINFNYFDTGSGDYDADLNQIVSAIKTSRAAIANQSVAYHEELPGAEVQTDEQIKTYIKDTAWGEFVQCSQC